MQKRLKKAFTLIELIIVIAIIAILAVTAFLVLTKWIGKSRDSRRLNDLSVIEGALQVNYTDTVTFPQPTSVQVHSFTDAAATLTLLSQGTVGDSVIKTLNLKGSMQDPDSTNLPNTYYSYALNSSGSKSNQYALMAYMEGTDYNTLSFTFSTATTYASRYPKLYGQRIGMIVDGSTKAPVTAPITFIGTDTQSKGVAIIDTPSSSNATAISGSELISLLGSAEPAYKLVAYYPFLSTTSTIERSGNDYPAATTAVAGTGKVGSGTDGGGAVIGANNISLLTSTTPSTITFWVYGLSGSTINKIATGTNFAISGNNNSIYFSGASATASIQGMSGTFSNVWTNLTLVYSPSDLTLSLYVNGTKIPNSITVTAGPDKTAAASFGGSGIQIDELRIYNRVFSADEAKLLYTAF